MLYFVFFVILVNLPTKLCCYRMFYLGSDIKYQYWFCWVVFVSISEAYALLDKEHLPSKTIKCKVRNGNLYELEAAVHHGAKPVKEYSTPQYRSKAFEAGYGGLRLRLNPNTIKGKNQIGKT